MFGLEEGLVALDVDVDFGVDELGDGVEAVGAAGEIGRGELDGPVLLMAEGGDFVGVGGDEDLIELRAGQCGFVNPCKHWATGDGAEDFAGESRGGEAGGDHSEDSRGALFGGHGIKYDGI